MSQSFSGQKMPVEKRNPLKTFALTTAQETTIRAALGMYLTDRQRNVDDAMDAGDRNAALFFQRHKDAAVDALRVMEEAYAV
jgi:hypothetical protein